MTPSAPPAPPAPEEPSFPRPILQKRRWPLLLVWLVPILAAIVAGFYFRDYLQDRGPEITVQFKDGSGLKPGETPVSHRGVQIGKVMGVQLSPDQRHVQVHVRLRRGADAFARDGALFWIVRPQISVETINGLETVFSGPYIETVPGSGAPAHKTQVGGLDSAPLALGPGLRIILHVDRVQSLAPGSPVYYRGIEVGVVEKVQLSPDAADVLVHAFVRGRYSVLVRTTSEFWVGLFTGVQVKLESLRTLFAGGIAFATPEKEIGVPAAPGDEFPLFDEPKKDWLKWTPKIPLGPGESE
jgi:paraquat-inducible protein B